MPELTCSQARPVRFAGPWSKRNRALPSRSFLSDGSSPDSIIRSPNELSYPSNPITRTFSIPQTQNPMIDVFLLKYVVYQIIRIQIPTTVYSALFQYCLVKDL